MGAKSNKSAVNGCGIAQKGRKPTCPSITSHHGGLHLLWGRRAEVSRGAVVAAPGGVACVRVCLCVCSNGSVPSNTDDSVCVIARDASVKKPPTCQAQAFIALRLLALLLQPGLLLQLHAVRQLLLLLHGLYFSGEGQGVCVSGYAVPSLLRSLRFTH